MVLDVLFALVFDIVGYHFLVSMRSHGREIVAFRPERSAPEFLPYLFVVFEYLLCGDAFYRLYHCRRQHHRDRLGEEVDMIFVSPYFEKMDLVRYRDAKTYLL